MPQSNFHIVGLKEAINFMLSAGTAPEIKRAVRSGMRAAAKRIVKSARARVPVDTGRLRRSIGVVNMRDEKGFPAIAVGARKKQGGWYAHFVEFGTSGVTRKGKRYRPDQPSRPFMRPAIDTEQGNVIDEVATHVASAYGNMMRRKLKKVS